MDKYALVEHLNRCMVEGICNGCQFGKTPFPVCRQNLAQEITKKIMAQDERMYYGRMSKCRTCVNYGLNPLLCDDCRSNRSRHYQEAK